MHTNHRLVIWPATRRKTALFLTLLLLLGHGGLTAQETKSRTETKDLPDATVVKLNKFVVTDEQDSGYGVRRAVIGSRIAKDIIDMPSSISVVPPELINDLGATYGGQAIKYVSAGVAFNSNSDDGNVMRGFGASILRNGTRLLWYKHMPMYDVERIEAVKGPANMLLGGSAGATGGAINFVTKLPTTTFKADSKVTVGTDTYFRVEANASGPIKKSEEFTALYRVSVGGEWGDPVRPMDRIEDSFFGGALRLDFGERIRFDVNGYYRVNNSNDYWPEFLDIVRSVRNGPAVLNPNTSRTFAAGRPDQESWDTDAYMIDATLIATLTDNATLRMNYTDITGLDRRRNLRGGSVAADNYTLNRQDILQDLHRSTRAGQAEYLYQTNRESWRNDFQLGAEFRKEFDGTNVDLLVPPALDTRNPDYSTYNVPNLSNWDTYYYNAARNTQRATTGSYWIQDNLTLLRDRLILVGGLRWSDASSVNESGNMVVRPGNLTTPYRLSRTESPIVKTHRYGIVVKPIKDVSVYYSEAQNSTPVAGFNSDGIPFKNSDGTLKEFGAKITKSIERFSISATVAAFEMAQTQIRISFPDPSVPTGIRQSQDPSGDTSKGWEAELAGRVNVDSGHFNLVATYYDAETRRVSDGGRNPGAPDNTYSLFAKYTWVRTGLKGATLGAGFYDQSLVRVGNNNTNDHPIIYNVLARYEFNRKWAVQLNGTNVTDETYIASVLNAALVQVAPRAEYRLSVKYIW